MQELDDITLLRKYVEPIAALVTRHVNKVYSVALRHTRNPHQAEEITRRLGHSGEEIPQFRQGCCPLRPAVSNRPADDGDFYPQRNPPRRPRTGSSYANGLEAAASRKL